MSSPYYTSALGPDDFVDVFDGLRHPTPPQHGKHGHGHHGRGHPERPSDSQHFYNDWFGTSSAPHADALLVAADALRKVYPKHSMVITSPYSADVLGFPGANFKPMEKTPLVATAFFVPIPRSAETVPGFLVDQLQFAAFEGNALGHDYLIYHVMVPAGFGSQPFYLILHEGPEEVARLLVLSAGAYQNELHEEIWVFNQGFWSKDHGLWVEAQKASWDDVILKDEFKKALQKDVYGFFDSRDIYKELSIPWKRGLIMYGPPGNGKTISLKTIIKTCDDKGFRPLYVKSFQSYMGEEGAMAVVFRKARELAPCVLVLEDIDSLINDRNRSFFLNQLDGLEGNDGLLIIGTTNHFDRLDPGLSTRPSRFDRKYKFDDPDEEERKLYARYWQNKLKSNKEIEFPDSLVDEVAKATDRFSFAYLKEAFVSSLVTYVGIEGDKPLFSEILFKEIDQLRQQLDKQFTNIQDYYTPMARMRISDSPSSQPGSPNMHHQRGHGKRGQHDHSADNSHFRHVLDRLTPGNVANPAQNKIFVAGRPSDMRRDRQMPSQSRAARGYAPTYIGDKDMMSGLGL